MGIFSLTQELAIDLGTANTLIIYNGKVVVDEPSIVALDVHTGKLVAIGQQARQMHEKTNPNIKTIRPLKDGVIADFNATELMLRGMIKKVKTSGRLFAPSLRMVICIPSGSTNVEIRAVRDSAEHAGGREVYMIYEPMAAALGAGLDVEAPEGNMVFDIGGGIPDGKKFKAVQIGGPSGGCCCASDEHLDLPLDFDSLKGIGAMIGSGGLVVMDEDTCMVETARFFMSFTQNESCGKCVPCREGTKRMLEILNRIINNEGSLEDLDMLENLSQTITETALCGLGQSACKPVQSTLRYFRKEYLAHVVDHHCPICNGRKRHLEINPELCKGCGKCLRNCPVGAIDGQIRMPHTIDTEKCIHCGACWGACPFGAIDAIEEEG